MKFIKFDGRIVNINLVQAISKVDVDGLFNIAMFFGLEQGIMERFDTAVGRDARFEEIWDLLTEAVQF